MSAFMRGVGKGEGWRVYDEVRECAGRAGQGRMVLPRMESGRASQRDARPVPALRRALLPVGRRFGAATPFCPVHRKGCSMSMPSRRAVTPPAPPDSAADGQITRRTIPNTPPVGAQTTSTVTSGDSDQIFFACLQEIERAFPDENDPNRYEAFAFLYQRVAFRHQQHAERLRTMAAAGGGR